MKSYDVIMFSGFHDDDTDAMSEMVFADNEDASEIDTSEIMEWSKDSMDNVPPLKAKITNVSLHDDSVMMNFIDIDKKDIFSYLEEIKSLGFDIDSKKAIMDEFISYKASNNKDHGITID